MNTLFKRLGGQIDDKKNYTVEEAMSGMPSYLHHYPTNDDAKKEVVYNSPKILQLTITQDGKTIYDYSYSDLVYPFLDDPYPGNLSSCSKNPARAGDISIKIRFSEAMDGDLSQTTVKYDPQGESSGAGPVNFSGGSWSKTYYDKDTFEATSNIFSVKSNYDGLATVIVRSRDAFQDDDSSTKTDGELDADGDGKYNGLNKTHQFAITKTEITSRRYQIGDGGYFYDETVNYPAFGMEFTGSYFNSGNAESKLPGLSWCVKEFDVEKDYLPIENISQTIRFNLIDAKGSREYMYWGGPDHGTYATAVLPDFRRYVQVHFIFCDADGNDLGDVSKTIYDYAIPEYVALWQYEGVGLGYGVPPTEVTKNPYFNKEEGLETSQIDISNLMTEAGVISPQDVKYVSIFIGSEVNNFCWPEELLGQSEEVLVSIDIDGIDWGLNESNTQKQESTAKPPSNSSNKIPFIKGKTISTGGNIKGVYGRCARYASTGTVERSSWTLVTPVDGAFDSQNEEYTYTVPEALSDGKYSIEIKSLNEQGEKDAVYQTARFTVDTASPIDVSITGVTAYSSSCTINVNASDSLSGLHSSPYKIRYSTSSDYNTQITTTTDWFSSTLYLLPSTLLPNTTYYFSVKARDNALNEGNWSDTFTKATLCSPTDNSEIGRPMSTTQTVVPETSVEITLSTGTANVKVEIPANTFTETVNMGLTAITSPVSDRPTIKVANVAIEITNDKGEQPSKEITLTITYSDGDVDGFDESKLLVGRYDEANKRWITLPSIAYPDQNKVVGWTNHLSKFAIIQLIPANDLSSVKVYPNPYNPKKQAQGLTIANLTPTADIKIYTVTGELVKVVPYTTGDGRAIWDGKNDADNEVASGVYIVIIKSSEGTKKIKIAVER